MADPIKRQLINSVMNRQMLVIGVFRELDREVTSQLIETFLYIAAHNPCHKQALEEDLDYLTSSCSRNVDWLSHRHRLKKPGLGLVMKVQDISNLRRFILHLTPKGESLVKHIEDLLNDSNIQGGH